MNQVGFAKCLVVADLCRAARLAMLSAAGLLVVLESQAYETTTHSILTDIAARRSVIGKDIFFFTNSGLYSATTSSFKYVGSGAAYERSGGAGDAIETMKWGVVYEDELPFALGSVAYDHFYNPQSGLGLRFSLASSQLVPTSNGGGGIASINWALEDDGKVQYDPNYGQGHGFTYRQAAIDYYNALTYRVPSDRMTAEGHMFQSLGHVVHHIQDMAQPQHTRNEAHIHFYVGQILDWKGVMFQYPWEIGRYELFTQSRENLIPSIVGSGYWFNNVPNFITGRDYIEGMADYTSWNFVTRYSEMSYVNGKFAPHPSFPRPGASSVKGFAPSVESATVSGKAYQLNNQYLIMNVVDPLTGSSVPIRAAQAGLYTELRSPNSKTYFSPNDTVFSDWNNVLLPRAVAFSQGLIDHFFRGRISLSSASTDGKSYKLTNTGSDSIDGTVTLLAEDVNGYRQELGPIRIALDSGASSTINLVKSPAPAPLIVAAFRGTVGVEGDPTAASTYYQVAGAIAAVPTSAPPPPPPPPPPPAPACTTSYSATGTTDFDATWNPGADTSGQVSVEFEAYRVPDLLTMTQGNKQVVNTTNMISGYHTYKFTNDGKPVKIHVGANQYEATQWDVRVACPGQTADNPLKRVKVGFYVQASSSPAGAPVCTAFTCSVDGGSSFSVGGGSGITYVTLTASSGPNTDHVLSCPVTTKTGTCTNNQVDYLYKQGQSTPLMSTLSLPAQATFNAN